MAKKKKRGRPPKKRVQEVDVTTHSEEISIPVTAAEAKRRANEILQAQQRQELDRAYDRNDRYETLLTHIYVQMNSMKTLIDMLLYNEGVTVPGSQWETTGRGAAKPE